MIERDDTSSDRPSYRCPNCDEVVHRITILGPSECYASPCGCQVSPLAFA